MSLIGRKWYLLVDPNTGIAHEVADDKDAAEHNAPFWGCVVVEVARTEQLQGAVQTLAAIQAICDDTRNTADDVRAKVEHALVVGVTPGLNGGSRP